MEAYACGGGDSFTALSVKQMLVLKDPLLVVFNVECV